MSLLLSQQEAINYKLINFPSITYVNHAEEKSSPICYAKSPIAQDVNTSSHHAGSCAGVTRRWGLLSYMQKKRQSGSLPIHMACTFH